MNSKTKYKGKKKIKHNVTKKLKYMASMGGKSYTTLKNKKSTGGATDEQLAAEKAAADAQAQAFVSSPHAELQMNQVHKLTFHHQMNPK